MASKSINETKKLMAALVRMKPKPHANLTAKSKIAKKSVRQRVSAKRETA